jgi:hypothetical protein
MLKLALFLLSLVALVVLSKKTAKEWNSFSVSKDLSEMEKTENEGMRQDLGDDFIPVAQPEVIFVFFGAALNVAVRFYILVISDIEILCTYNMYMSAPFTYT